MATLKARETLHLPANAKPRKIGKLVARAKLKGNKKRKAKLSGNDVALSVSVEYPIK